MKNLIFLGGEDVSARIEISKKFMALGYNIEIIGTEKADKFKQNNIAYATYQFNREFSIMGDIKTIFELRTILKEKNSRTIVHAFDTKPTLFLPFASIGLKNINVVRTITGMGRIFTEKSLKNSILTLVYNLLQKAISKRVDFTVFQNDDDGDYYLKHHLVSKEKSSVIKSSGLDLEKFTTEVDNTILENLKKTLALDPNEKTFILVSRMVKQKGIMNYLQAAKLCHEQGHKFNFLLVGQLDSDESITFEEIHAYKKYVHYLGRREDVKNLLALCDVFVLPTYYREGVPRVLLEASAMGLALLATNMPGCKDVVMDGYNGKLIEIENPQDLYEKMVYITQNEEQLKSYGKNAQEKVKEFDLNIVVNAYHTIYQKL